MRAGWIMKIGDQDHMGSRSHNPAYQLVNEDVPINAYDYVEARLHAGPEMHMLCAGPGHASPCSSCFPVNDCMNRSYAEILKRV